MRQTSDRRQCTVTGASDLRDEAPLVSEKSFVEFRNKNKSNKKKAFVAGWASVSSVGSLTLAVTRRLPAGSWSTG
jgi:hypothetical protein